MVTILAYPSVTKVTTKLLNIKTQVVYSHPSSPVPQDNQMATLQGRASHECALDFAAGS